MAEATRKWPQSGLEPFFEYRTSFIHLNINLGSADACRTYHDHWMRRYRAAMADWDDFQVAAWSVRLRQSLKLCYSATYFALASEEVAIRAIMPHEIDTFDPYDEEVRVWQR